MAGDWRGTINTPQHILFYTTAAAVETHMNVGSKQGRVDG